MPTISVKAPRATLTLEVARYAYELAGALRCQRSLDPHHGVLYVQPTGPGYGANGTVLGPGNQYLSVDEAVIGAGGQIVAVILNQPAVLNLKGMRSPTFWIDAPYVIDVAAGEAERDGLTPGATVQLDMSDARLQPARQIRPLLLPCTIKTVPQPTSSPAAPKL